MMKRIISIVLFSVLVLQGCSNDESNETSKTDDIKQLVQELSGNKEVKAASISSETLTVENDGETKKYNLPEGEFFVSMAPYINETHPCEIHSLSGCQGELVGEDIEVLIEDEGGEVVVDETMTTPDNGFLDFWLEKGKQYHVTMKHDGKVVEKDITTNEGDNTCITDLQLK